MESALLLSAYLLGPDDILRSAVASSDDDDDAATQRATLYARLSRACQLANESSRCESFRRGSRGDGWSFGVHCCDDDDEEGCASRPDDSERRRRRRHAPHLRARCRYASSDEAWHVVAFAMRLSEHLSRHDLDCAVRCVDASDGQLMLIEAAEVLPSWVDDEVSQGGVGGPRGCGERCWIVRGKLRLIPPSCSADADAVWDEGTVAPQRAEFNGDFAALERTEALRRLRDCLYTDKFVVHQVQEAIQARIERTDYSLPRRSKPKSAPCNTAANGDEKRCTASTKESHYHVAAVALPASVAYFLSEHWYLAPFFVDSFCRHAPQYWKERPRRVAPRANDDRGTDDNDAMDSKVDASSTADVHLEDGEFDAECDPNSSHHHHNNKHNGQSANTPKHPFKLQLGTHFSYERIVLLPFTMTRTTYAELITGRGIVPSFPIPVEYRSVELNRFQRRLGQMARGWGHRDDDDNNDDDDNDGRKRKNVWKRAVEIGIRLCAGIEWILLNPRHGRSVPNTLSMTEIEQEKRELQSMGDVERRLRLYWCRIDAEASGRARRSEAALDGNDSTDGEAPSPSWIEQTWQAGPNNPVSSDKAPDKVRIEALQSMSKCPVFYPELSKPPHEEPCPYSRPGVSLHEMTHSGIRRALKWVRDEYSDASFPFPREWEVDDDSWMEVNSLQELEDEMSKLSSANEQTRTTREVVGKKSRRVARKGRRNRIQEYPSEDVDANDESDRVDADKESEDATSLNKMLHGFKSLVEGEGDLGGVVTRRPAASTSRDCVSPQRLMSEEVSINARVFLNLLHEKLRRQRDATSEDGIKERETTEEQDDISKFFYKEDLEDDSSSDSLDSNNTGMTCDELDHTSFEQDPGSIQNIMQAMDQELRTATAIDPSSENLSAQADHNDTNGADYAMLSNFLKSLEAEGTQPGPVTNILREMGICPPRLSSHERIKF